MALLNKEDFYNTFFQKDKISPVFSKLFYKYNNSKFYNSESTEINKDKPKVNFISLFPKYLYPEIANTNNVTVKKIQQNKLDGFAIVIDGVKNVDTYLANTFKSSTRGPIKKKIKRLESCFNIHYKMFYGDITEVDYNIIMPQLKTMIKRRFIQRNNTNEALGKWDSYLNTTLSQIKTKEASLFVLYSDNEIIGISLNYHVNKVFIGHIIAYNIDYSKFGLGNTIVYKLLEWSIKNDYAIFDMGNGALDYKRIWSNLSYNYEYYIVYKKSSFLALFFGQLQVFKVQFKNLLKKYNVVDNFRKIKAHLLGKNKQDVNLKKSLSFEEIKAEVFIQLKLTKIEFHNVANNLLKKAVIDFTFAHRDHINDIEVFKVDHSTFIIKGTKNIQKIIID
ncbi:GNAT family N-acetyltransferase [Hwangdonia sp.]|uniref:GNAT family N-acetyltransferase n=1 Tax=Hwangdonia sp. TaxID=1883432 RepID=UPI003AB2A44B